MNESLLLDIGSEKERKTMDDFRAFNLYPKMFCLQFKLASSGQTAQKPAYKPFSIIAVNSCFTFFL